MFNVNECWFKVDEPTVETVEEVVTYCRTSTGSKVWRYVQFLYVLILMVDNGIKFHSYSRKAKNDNQVQKISYFRNKWNFVDFFLIAAYTYALILDNEEVADNNVRRGYIVLSFCLMAKFISISRITRATHFIARLLTESLANLWLILASMFLFIVFFT